MSIARYVKILVCYTVELRHEDIYTDTEEYPIEFQIGDINSEVEDMLSGTFVDFDLDKGIDCSHAFINVTIPSDICNPEQVEKRIQKIILSIGHNAKIFEAF